MEQNYVAVILCIRSILGKIKLSYDITQIEFCSL